MKRVFFNLTMVAMMFFAFVLPFTAITAEATTVEDEPAYVEETVEAAETAESESEVPEWNGEVLTARMGVLKVGPNGGCEKWHNKDMSERVKGLKDIGIELEYWVSDDGIQMYGPYVLVGANLEIYDIGDVIVCSWGEAIVCDTGDYAKIDPLWVNIATVWKSC